MQAYFIKVGSQEQGPFLSKGAATTEAKELKGKGYTVKVVSKEISEDKMFEALGNPEAEVDIDEDDIDLDAIFDDDDDDDDEGDDDDDDEGDDDDDDEGDDDDDDDDAPKGEHGWFKQWGNKKGDD